ncbi:glutaredoxin family protein [Planococcus maitriensis]|uniref:NrdH-redoxin n=1 Tax=Planococcus maitriensis TaxID=221799 RepID=A0A365KA62_9BACL|nr:glutaredoxin family protein [Planococcus maitriensis]RAZ69670.1 NrdH-redoxin [Planococcus maitriensis]
MDKKLELVLYTRPTCSDCSDAKAYLAEHGIPYEHKNVEEKPELEEEMKKISGAKIVPVFAFYKKGLFGKKLAHQFIGFERNRDEILGLVHGK